MSIPGGRTNTTLWRQTLLPLLEADPSGKNMGLNRKWHHTDRHVWKDYLPQLRLVLFTSNLKLWEGNVFSCVPLHSQGWGRMGPLPWCNVSHHTMTPVLAPPPAHGASLYRDPCKFHPLLVTAGGQTGELFKLVHLKLTETRMKAN